MAFLLICNKYSLDPFRKEIYAFRQGGKVVPIVGIDGWCSVVNREEAYDGCEFENEFDDQKRLVSTTCRIYRKDRSHPTVVTEYVAECKRNTPAWNGMTARMNRHRSFIQSTRYAFGISGLMERDEFEQMVEAQVRVMPNKAPPATLSDLTARLNEDKAAQAPASAAVTTPSPMTGQPEPAAAVPPRRRTRKEAPVTAVEALTEEPPFTDESGTPIPAAAQAAPPAPAKPVTGQQLYIEVMQLKGQLGDAMFAQILKPHGALEDLGTDSLRNLRNDCLKAIG